MKSLRSKITKKISLIYIKLKKILAIGVKHRTTKVTIKH
jgi:hypothetical protein